MKARRDDRALAQPGEPITANLSSDGQRQTTADFANERKSAHRDFY